MEKRAPVLLDQIHNAVGSSQLGLSIDPNNLHRLAAARVLNAVFSSATRESKEVLRALPLRASSLLSFQRFDQATVCLQLDEAAPNALKGQRVRAIADLGPKA